MTGSPALRLIATPPAPAMRREAGDARRARARPARSATPRLRDAPRAEAVLLLDVAGRIRWCSDAGHELFEPDAEPTPGRPVHELVPALPLRPEGIGFNLAYVEQWFGDGVWLERPSLDAAGVLYTLELRVELVTLGPEPGFVVRLRRREAEPTVTTDLQRCAEASEGLEAALLIADADGLVGYANPAFESLTGHPRHEALGRHVFFATGGGDGADRFEEAKRRLHDARRVKSTRRATCRDGTVRHVDECVRPFVDARGRITHYVVTLVDASDRVAAEQRLMHLAHHDPLTGLANRAQLAERVREAIDQGARRGGGFAVLCLDIDGFKAVNDEHGHAAGDELLQALARRLAERLGPQDLAARLGGDEFAVLLGGARTLDEVRTAVQAIHHALADAVVVDGRAVRLAVSIGAARFPYDGLDGAALLRAADRAMYAAKGRGRAGAGYR